MQGKNKCWVAVVRASLRFRWPRRLDKLKYLKSYGRKNSKRPYRRKAIRGSFHMLYFSSFY